MPEERDNPTSLCLPDWLTMHQALAWVSYRNAEFAANADADSMMAEHLWPSMEARAWRADLASALQNKRIVAEGARRGGDWEEVPSAQWHRMDIAPRDPERHQPYEMIRVSRANLLSVFPPPAAPRASHEENVIWCTKWMAGGNGKGMDKAWPSFTREPSHKGISRDSFRLAWNEAKGRKGPTRPVTR